MHRAKIHAERKTVRRRITTHVGAARTRRGALTKRINAACKAQYSLLLAVLLLAILLLAVILLLLSALLTAFDRETSDAFRPSLSRDP